MLTKLFFLSYSYFLSISSLLNGLLWNSVDNSLTYLSFSNSSWQLSYLISYAQFNSCMERYGFLYSFEMYLDIVRVCQWKTYKVVTYVTEFGYLPPYGIINRRSNIISKSRDEPRVHLDSIKIYFRWIQEWTHLLLMHN